MNARKNEFEILTQRRQTSIGAEFLLFLRDNKKWWLLPVLLVLAAVSLLTALAGTGVAPFIYTMF
jgi:Family of unknown function (DUF5989)